MVEKNLNHGVEKRSTAMAYTRATVGSATMIYAAVNSATGIGLLGFVVFFSGVLDIYINSNNDEIIDKSTNKLCS